MKPLGDPVSHFWKVKRMARVTGVDLVAAQDQGDLSTAEWAAMVTRCRGCEWVDGCAQFLDTHIDGEAEPPRACLNAKVFQRLQP